jgi:FkbM family methyltransferase
MLPFSEKGRLHLFMAAATALSFRKQGGSGSKVEIMISFPGLNRFTAWRQQAAREAFQQEIEGLGRASETPFFVKVGAHDGCTGDPCTEFLLAESKWHGLLIEPVPAFAEKLRERFGDKRRFAVLQMAVGQEEGSTPFYYVLKEAEERFPDLPQWYNQLSSFDMTHIEKHLGAKIRPFVGTLQVAVKPLGKILENHQIKTIDLLQIDTEGYDFVVLQSLDLGTHRPRVIFVEHKHLSDQDRRAMQRLLVTNGYTVRDCGGDFFAKLRVR